jgi:hypothetical protein
MLDECVGASALSSQQQDEDDDEDQRSEADVHGFS